MTVTATTYTKDLDRKIDVSLPSEDVPAGGPAFFEELARRYTPSMYLDVGNVCNIACTYCCVPRPEAYISDRADLDWIVDAAAQQGIEGAVFIGGEPTIYRDFFKLLARLRARRYREIVLTTNGLMLGYREFVDRMVDGGVSIVHLSYDDFDPDVLVQLLKKRQAPAVLDAALENLVQRPEPMLYLYAVVCRQNVGHFDEYVRRVAALQERRGTPIGVMLAAMKPMERAMDHWDDIMPRMAEAAAAIGSAVDVGRELGVPVVFKHVPPCLLPDHQAHNFDRYVRDGRMDLSTGRSIPPPRSQFDVKGAPCEGCPHDAACYGVHRNYVDGFGWGEFGARGGDGWR